MNHSAALMSTYPNGIIGKAMVKVAYKESGQPGEYAHKVLSEANIRDLLGFLMITPEFSFRGKETNGKDTYFRFSCDKPGTFADLEVTVSYG